MATYIILSRLAPDAVPDPKEFKKLAATVTAKIKTDCPGVNWKDSYATFGRFDFVDIIESEDPMQVERAAMIIRAYGKSSTETMTATAWRDFLGRL